MRGMGCEVWDGSRASRGSCASLPLVLVQLSCSFFLSNCTLFSLTPRSCLSCSSSPSTIRLLSRHKKAPPPPFFNSVFLFFFVCSVDSVQKGLQPPWGQSSVSRDKKALIFFANFRLGFYIHSSVEWMSNPSREIFKKMKLVATTP